jgi:hypothetical protein
MKESAPDPCSWPVGIHLRFKLDASVQPQYEALRGTPVLVVGRPQMTDIPEGSSPSSIRQEVFAYAIGRMGAALPAQLERIPERRDNSASRFGQRVEE